MNKFFQWFWCVLFHPWEYRTVLRECANGDLEPQRTAVCRTCGRKTDA